MRSTARFAIENGHSVTRTSDVSVCTVGMAARGIRTSRVLVSLSTMRTVVVLVALLLAAPALVAAQPRVATEAEWARIVAEA